VSRAIAALLLCAAAARAQEGPPKETAIPVPLPAPSGFLLAWKPMVLTVRVDTGVGSHLGSDKFQFLRALGRYTAMAKEGTPFFGRIEVEGGQFETDAQLVGSRGYDFAGRFTAGAATRLFPNLLFVSTLGPIVRYQHGSAVGGAPSIGNFGIMVSVELEYRFSPSLTLMIMGEAAVAPFPFMADKNLGDLSDSSEVRGRIQLAFDVTTTFAVEVGYDFTRWHSSFVSSTIIPANTNGALLLEAREYAATFGLRWKL